MIVKKLLTHYIHFRREQVVTWRPRKVVVAPTQFWVQVRETKSGDNEPMYPHLSAFMLNLLCLPHSSATVERVFSSINRMKTKLRNRLSSNTIGSILHTKRLISDKNCYDFELPKAMVKRMNNQMYKQNSQQNTADSDDDNVDD